MRHWPLRRRENCRINAPGLAKTRVFLHRDCPKRAYFCTQRDQTGCISAPEGRWPRSARSSPLRRPVAPTTRLQKSCGTILSSRRQCGTAGPVISTIPLIHATDRGRRQLSYGPSQSRTPTRDELADPLPDMRDVHRLAYTIPGRGGSTPASSSEHAASHRWVTRNRIAFHLTGRKSSLPAEGSSLADPGCAEDP